MTNSIPATKRVVFTHEKLMEYHSFRNRGLSTRTATKAALRGWKATAPIAAIAKAETQ